MSAHNTQGGRSALRTLIVPGLNGSGPQHWQNLWQKAHPDYERVEQKDWNTVHLETWARAVVRQIEAANSPVILVAHSFGCLAAVRAGELAPAQIRGALLVAPANPGKFGVDALVSRLHLGFPSVVVASRNDPWMPYLDAVAWSRRWGSRFADAGNAGHINVEAGYGRWPEGERLLGELRAVVLREPSGSAISLAA